MMRKFLLVAFVSLAALSAPAYADFYVGASYLSTDADFSTAVDEFSLDDSGYKIFAGWDFIKFVGLELSYRDMGTFEDGGFGTDLTSYDAAVRGIIPLKFLELFGKIGYADIKAEGEDSGVSFDESEWELFYGVGIGFNFGSHFGIRAEWETYDTDENLNTFSAGALFKF
jgi:OOP family OmpA-OmpF porin